MATPDAFLPPGFDTPQQYIEALISFIDQYRWLYEVHVVDIFPYQQWELLDPSWREALLADSDNDAWFETIIALPSFDRKVVCMWVWGVCDIQRCIQGQCINDVVSYFRILSGLNLSKNLYIRLNQ